MASCRVSNNLLALFLSLSILFLTCKSGRNLRDEEDMVSTACKHTQYYEICVSSLGSDPHSQTTSYLGDIASISLNVSIAYAMDTLSYINGLKTPNPETTKFMYSCLSDCQEEYSDAIENLEGAVDALKKKSYDTVNSLVSAAMTDSDTCEDGFKEMSISESTLSMKNQYFYKLCSNFLAISTLLT